MPQAAIGRAVGAGEAGGEKGEGARVARTPCAERDATLVGFESLRLACSERAGWRGGAAPAGAVVFILLDRWLTPPANLRQAFGLEGVLAGC
jgi:hypothetical protein